MKGFKKSKKNSDPKSVTQNLSRTLTSFQNPSRDSFKETSGKVDETKGQRKDQEIMGFTKLRSIGNSFKIPSYFFHVQVALYCSNFSNTLYPLSAREHLKISQNSINGAFTAFTY